MPAVDELRIRNAVRALILDPESRILLVRWDFPPRPELQMPAVSVWGTPGGGVEADEDLHGALRRELSEELGIDDVDIGPQVWDRIHVIPFLDGRWDGQHDRFYIVRSDRFEPCPRLTREQLRAEYLAHIRWWTPEELAVFAPSDREFFAPRRLPGLVAELLATGVPPEPIDTGV
jgi:8-oxo-dGTP pyrophosphatase MutT (NUDIX family)